MAFRLEAQIEERPRGMEGDDGKEIIAGGEKRHGGNPADRNGIIQAERAV
ncbi:MAG: hypothetical protein LBD58_08205 [Treponema sp.]|nr:hypothetical protein [Treponema sp.]